MCNEIALKKPGKIPKTYLVNNAGHFFAKLTKQIRAISGQKEDAALRIKLSAVARNRLKEVFGVEWHDCRLLDVGCGQLLRHALIFGVDNSVVGIDVELPFRYP